MERSLRKTCSSRMPVSNSCYAPLHFYQTDILFDILVARGFMRSGQGNPDEARAARFILKDYVNAKLLFCQPPPGVDSDEFNQATRELAMQRAAGKKRAPTTRVGKNADTFIAGDVERIGANGILPAKGQGHKSQTVDTSFFADEAGLAARPFVAGARFEQGFSRAKLYPHQNAVADDGTPLGGRRARIASVMANAGDAHPGKKHHKKGKRVKQRSGKGYE